MTKPAASVRPPVATPIPKQAQAHQAQPKPGEYATKGASPAMKRRNDARRALEDRQALREIGLL